MKKVWSRIILLLIVSSLFFTACSKKGATDESTYPKEINFGILRVPNDETIAIAEGLFDKYFTEKGIKCNFIVFDSGVDANKAFASGSIDFATMGNTNGIIALVRDLKVEMIWIHEVLGEIEALAVKNNSGITKMKDLVGKQVATTFASTSHYILLNALKIEGIDDKVQLLDMQTLEIVAAWERGDLQAAYTWQPSLGALLKDGKVLISSEDMARQGYITANVELVRKEFAEKYPDLVASYIACMNEAADIYRKDPNKAARIVAEELQIEEADALMQMQDSIWVSAEDLLKEDYFGSKESRGAFAKIMKDTSDFLQGQKSIDRSPSQDEFDKYVNPKYIERAIELFSN